ncbi:MAG: HD domain-containing protein [Thermomicrobiales bacterium]
MTAEESRTIPFATLDFFLASERLKREYRMNTLLDDSRHESVAEHCWHLSLLAILLEPYAPPDIDLLHVRDLITIHDLVEVYAGDSWFYSDATDIAEREAASATRLLALLPDADAERFRPLIDEFQTQHTREARYARALDVLHPMILSYAPGGSGPTAPQLTASIVLGRKRPHLEDFPALWDFAQRLVAGAIERGVIAPG